MRSATELGHSILAEFEDEGPANLAGGAFADGIALSKMRERRAEPAPRGLPDENPAARCGDSEISKFNQACKLELDKRTRCKSLICIISAAGLEGQLACEMGKRPSSERSANSRKPRCGLLEIVGAVPRGAPRALARRFPAAKNDLMTEDTAQKMLRDAGVEATRTGMSLTVVGYRLNVVVAPNPPGSVQPSSFFLHDRNVSLTVAAAAMAESAGDLAV